MAAAGINKRVLGKFGGTVHNFISDPDVAAEAKERGLTRSAVCMERAAALGEPLIYAVGNAPTALVRLYEMLQAGEMPVKPALIVGVPLRARRAAYRRTWSQGRQQRRRFHRERAALPREQ